jgi:hypothetical protein
LLSIHLLNDGDAWDYVYTSVGDEADGNVEFTAVPVPELCVSVGLLLAGRLGTITLPNRSPKVSPK